MVTELEEVPMSIVGGFDVHRQQITFDALDVESGEVWRGRIWQPDRERFRRWLWLLCGAAAAARVLLFLIDWGW